VRAVAITKKYSSSSTITAQEVLSALYKLNGIKAFSKFEKEICILQKVCLFFVCHTPPPPHPHTPKQNSSPLSVYLVTIIFPFYPNISFLS
jgi:hypothetical protein